MCTNNFAFVCLLLWVTIKSGRSNSGFSQICNGTLGSLSLSPKSSHLFSMDEGTKVRTVFVNYQKEFKFECVLARPDANNRVNITPQIEFKPGLDNSTRLEHSYSNNTRTDRSLNASLLQHLNSISYKNFTVECKLGNPDKSKEEDSSEEQLGDEICKVNIIIINRIDTNCSLSRSLFCQAEDILTKLNTNRHGEFLPTIRYSIFIPDNQSWVYCNETVEKGTIAKPGLHLDSSTEFIVCPVPKRSFKGPVLIRVEESHKTGLSVGLPYLSNKGNMSFTFFSVYLNQTVVYEDNDLTEGTPLDKGEDSAGLFAGIAIGSVLLILMCAFIVFCTRKVWLAKKKENKTSHFYIETSGEDTKYLDTLSNRTQTTATNLYTRSDEATDIQLHDLGQDNFFLFDEYEEDYSTMSMLSDGEDEAAVSLRRTIVARQLSGDPSKINPALTLNQQANALPYNPKLEIERAKFTIGQLLGSGNFGSVYVGEAEGIFYPGSLTKVAVKTVNDALDRSQLAALLCEVKILANLDHHLNLVNLMGSCTSELHNGELWLLLEFCAHGDLKNFLIRNRTEFQNNLNGVCATGLDCRLFLKWAHSIAKGMEYLTSRRIMHGDLAARNILIAGSGGYIAKVSDFGLSKTFYDNVRYKKRFRHYVPWKWMAIEYLKDACFTMKSDVWSYGVVLWEIMSLGQEPYAGKSIEEVVTKIKTGYRMPCPEEVADVTWATDVYRDVMKKCWDADPSTRCSFGEIVNSLEKLMDKDELEEYQDCSLKCRNMKELMLDDSNRSRRSTLLSPHSAPGNYTCVTSLSPGIQTGTTSGYVTVEQANSGCLTNPHQPIDVSIIDPQQFFSTNGYITVEQMRNNSVVA